MTRGATTSRNRTTRSRSCRTATTAAASRTAGDGPEAALLPVGLLEEAAECLRIMAHPVRLRIVDILMQGDFPVHEIAALCGLPAHQASEHLRLLQGRGLLASRRAGRTVYYRVASPRLPALLRCIGRTCGADRRSK
jgi:ArsR family transcriptional regulator, zinc-responsive transcriptional repressor